MKQIALALFGLLLATVILPVNCMAQEYPTLYHGWWQGNLLRADGQPIVFNFLVKDSARKTILYIRNATERLLVDDVKVSGDSVHIGMPFFEASFRARIMPDGQLEGEFVRRLAKGELTQPFLGLPRTEERFALSSGDATAEVQGRYAVRFADSTGQKEDTAVGEFVQQGNHLTGTFLTPSGDYRFLEGVVTGDSVKLSTFDGNHAYVFTAQAKTGDILSGKIFSNKAPASYWTGVADPDAGIPVDEAAPKLRNPDSAQLHFAFPDMDSNIVSIRDPKFRGKVVVLTIMGSWCPNCMDETRFLSPWYDKNHKRGVEVLGLAYERSTDFQRSRKSLMTFRNRFNVHYPFLITGVPVGDPDKARKTLPEIDDIKGFPTMIILDKKGNARIFRAGFEGPGTGEHYLMFQKEFNSYIDELLSEQE